MASKTSDPAVVCLDEGGTFVISLLSGHIGGCNALTERIAQRLGAEPIVTTATDLNGRFSVDTFATVNGMRLSSLKIAKDVSARVLDGRFVGFSRFVRLGRFVGLGRLVGLGRFFGFSRFFGIVPAIVAAVFAVRVPVLRSVIVAVFFAV